LFAALLVSLCGSVAGYPGNSGPGANCSAKRCYNAENLCGSFSQPCRAFGSSQSGLVIWLSVRFEFNPSGNFRRVESGFFDEQACRAEDPWLEVEYSGNWHNRGGSSTVRGLSLADVDVSSVWITLRKQQVCVRQADKTEICMNTLQTLQALCPCNGWDWANRGMPRQRNVGMFCLPREQCPLIHEVYLQQTHYFSYNATASGACFSKVSIGTARGWVNPEDDACTRKKQRLDCLAGVLSGANCKLNPFVLGTYTVVVITILLSQSLIHG